MHMKFISILYQQDTVDSKRCLSEANKEFRDGQHLFNQKVHIKSVIVIRVSPSKPHTRDIIIYAICDYHFKDLTA